MKKLFSTILVICSLLGGNAYANEVVIAISKHVTNPYKEYKAKMQGTVFKVQWHARQKCLKDYPSDTEGCLQYKYWTEKQGWRSAWEAEVAWYQEFAKQNNLNPVATKEPSQTQPDSNLEEEKRKIANAKAEIIKLEKCKDPLSKNILNRSLLINISAGFIEDTILFENQSSRVFTRKILKIENGIILSELYETPSNQKYKWQLEIDLDLNQFGTTAYDVSNNQFINDTSPYFCQPKKIIAEKPEKKSKEENAKLYVIGLGTGFFVSSEGHVVSNDHVVGNCRKVAAKIEGEINYFNVINTDQVNDLGLIKGGFKSKNFLNIKSDGAEFGEDIIAFGYPLSNDLSTSVKLTRGIVSSLSGPGNNYSEIQIDAAIQPGNSGGPVLNMSGQVVGVASSGLNKLYMLEKSEYIPENVNFAVSATTLSNFLKSNGVIISNEKLKISNTKELAKVGRPATLQLFCRNKFI